MTNTRTPPRLLYTLALGLAVIGAADCPPVSAHGSSGSAAQITLRFATSHSSPADAAFAAALKQLSGGRVQVETIAYAADAADVDQRIAADLAAGKLDVADVASRAWESRGVTAFRVLQEPFLITSRALLDKVLADPQVAAPMLKALDPIHVTGLAVVPVGPRYLFAAHKPLAALPDFRHKRVRINTSAMTAGILRDLGARPVTSIMSGEPTLRALRSGKLDAVESDIATAVANGYIRTAPHVAVDTPLFAKATTIVANAGKLGQLDAATAQLVAQAAQQAATSTRDAEAADWKIACRQGLIPDRTTPSQLDAMRVRELATYAEIDSTPDVVLTQRIGLLATTLPRTDSWAGCHRDATRSSTRVLDGRYFHTITNADASAAGDNPANGNAGPYQFWIGHGRYAALRPGSAPDPSHPDWVPGKDPVEVGSVTISGNTALFRPDTSIANGSLPNSYRFEVFRGQLRFSADGNNPVDYLMTAEPWKPMH
jgi:TRAP-type C4-dicarboxylate transport system substrate-binding protein